MGIYKPITNLRIKDILASGDPQKLIVGAELQREFEAVNLAVDSMVGGYDGPLVNYAAKDLLTTGNADKKVLGATLDAEFAAIDTALTEVPGWAYTPATTFASEVTVTGDKIQDEFEAISAGIVTAWDTYKTDSTAPGGPFWEPPLAPPSPGSHTIEMTGMPGGTGNQEISVFIKVAAPDTPLYQLSAVAGDLGSVGNGGVPGASGFMTTDSGTIEFDSVDYTGTAFPPGFAPAGVWSTGSPAPDYSAFEIKVELANVVGILEGSGTFDAYLDLDGTFLYWNLLSDLSNPASADIVITIRNKTSLVTATGTWSLSVTYA